MATLSGNAYGKSRVRLSKITRTETAHRFQELTADIYLSGAFDAAYTAGDNATVLPTDTIKNTVYALAKTHPIDTIEQFALDLTTRYLQAAPAADSAKVVITETPWRRMQFDGEPHHHAFLAARPEHRYTVVSRTRAGMVTLQSGIKALPILKTTGSGFVGFLKDEYTVLPEETDRIMATNLSALWTWQTASAAFNSDYIAIRETLLQTFANHESASVQHTLNEMGGNVLAAVSSISDIKLWMPNVHHFQFDLSRFGIDNDNTIFAPADEPHGYIEGYLTR